MSSLSDVFQDIGEKATKAAKAALSNGADMVVNDAKTRCPVRTGALKESIHKVVLRGGTRIKVIADATNDNGVPYGRFVEFSPMIQAPASPSSAISMRLPMMSLMPSLMAPGSFA